MSPFLCLPLCPSYLVFFSLGALDIFFFFFFFLRLSDFVPSLHFVLFFFSSVRWHVGERVSSFVTLVIFFIAKACSIVLYLLQSVTLPRVISGFPCYFFLFLPFTRSFSMHRISVTRSLQPNRLRTKYRLPRRLIDQLERPDVSL